MVVSEEVEVVSDDGVKMDRVFDESIVLKDNSMLKVKPRLFDEWDFGKNDKLGLDVYKVTKGSVKRANWICVKCASRYNARIDSRMRSDCPYCSGQSANHTNSLASLRPDIAAQWHPVLNDNLTPHDVTCGKDTRVWWLGLCSHKWESPISDRAKENGTNCPYCAPNSKVLAGFNDIWTVNPTLAKFLLNPEDGYKYTQGSKVKVDWKCQECGAIAKDKQIHKTYSRGFSCPSCSDGFSVPEKIMYSLLTQLKLDFTPQEFFRWSEGKKYDFFLPDCNMIIETHGKQHYEEGFQLSGSMTLKETQENDKDKREKALANGISYYVEIDCRESEIEYIKSAIIGSDLTCHFDLSEIDWKILFFNAFKSRVVEACNIYNKNANEIPLMDMARELKIHESTFRGYLMRGTSLGLCNYTPHSQQVKKISVKHLERKVVQLDLNETLMNQWNSIRDAGRSLGKASSSSISACCKGKAKTAFGYIWMYKEDYDNLN